MRSIYVFLIIAFAATALMASIEYTVVRDETIEKAKSDCIENITGEKMSEGLVIRKFRAWKMRYRRYVRASEKGSAFLNEKFGRIANNARKEIYEYYCSSAPKETRLPILE